tara:strand:- start:104 stop:433 length:330 start_codon:yes stop_codon:yes gene_type:complete
MLQKPMPKKPTTKLYLNPITTKPSGKTDFEKLRKMSDADIDARRGNDPNLPDIDWATAEIERVDPVIKQAVSIRLDSDVIDFFKEGGRGYQTRINKVLRSYMDHQKEAG